MILYKNRLKDVQIVRTRQECSRDSERKKEEWSSEALEGAFIDG